MCDGRITVKNWLNLPISDPKPDLHNINAHTKFGETPLMFTQVIIWKQNTERRMADRHTDIQCETITPATILWRGIKTQQIESKKLNGR